jgi:DNA-binding response OmpR family regulator
MKKARAIEALLISSDQSMLGMLSSALSGKPSNTRCINNGIEALHMLVRQGLDLLIIGPESDDIDSIQLCAEARQLSPESTILLIAKDSRHVVTALQLGADDVLVMPFTVEEFLARVDSKLRRSQWG